MKVLVQEVSARKDTERVKIAATAPFLKCNKPRGLTLSRCANISVRSHMPIAFLQTAIYESCASGHAQRINLHPAFRSFLIHQVSIRRLEEHYSIVANTLAKMLLVAGIARSSNVKFLILNHGYKTSAKQSDPVCMAASLLLIKMKKLTNALWCCIQPEGTKRFRVEGTKRFRVASGYLLLLKALNLSPAEEGAYLIY